MTSFDTDVSWCHCFVGGATVQGLKASHIQFHSAHLCAPGEVRTLLWGVKLDLKGVQHLGILKLEREVEFVPLSLLCGLKAAGQPGELILCTSTAFLAGILCYFFSSDDKLAGMQRKPSK